MQERIIHLLEEHTEPDDSIRHGINQIVSCLQRNPILLNFCKECKDKKKLNVSNMIELIDFLRDETQPNISMIMSKTYYEAFKSLK